MRKFIPATLSGVVLTLSLAFTAAMTVSGMPVLPGGAPATLTQPDGKVIQVNAFGDEFYNLTQSEDGYTIILNADGAWTYAVLNVDKTQLVSSGLIVGKDDPAMAGLTKGIDLPVAVRNVKIDQNYKNGLRPLESQRRFMAEKIQALKASGVADTVLSPMVQEYRTIYGKTASGSAAPILPASITNPGSESIPEPGDPGYGKPRPPLTVRNVNGLAILVRFEGQIGQPTSISEIDSALNLSNYSNDTFQIIGSVKDYFNEQSNGKLVLTHRIANGAFVTLPKRVADYVATDNPQYEILKDAVKLLTETDTTYAALTKNADNSPIAVTILYDGIMNPSLWPCAKTVPSTDTVALNDTVRVRDYAFSSLLTETPAAPFIPGVAIGPICHELGHTVLGFGDYYDYGSPILYNSNDARRSAGIGIHCLMGYGCTTVPTAFANNVLPIGFDKAPMSINAYLKLKAGWFVPRDVWTLGSSANIDVDIMNNYRYVHYNPEKPGEYFVFENMSVVPAKPAAGDDPWARYRGFRGYDRWITKNPAKGLAIWHVDETVTTRNELQQRNILSDKTVDSHYELSLEQADGKYDLEYFNVRDGVISIGNLGDKADYFNMANTVPTEGGITGRSDKFEGGSTPSSNWWDGKSSGLAINSGTEFPASGPSMRLSISAMPLNRVLKVAATTHLTDRITITWDYSDTMHNLDPSQLYYRVYRTTTPKSPTELDQVTDWRMGSFIYEDMDVNLKVNLEYYYYIMVSTNNVGASRSLASDPVIGMRTIETPPAPTASNSFMDKIVVSWPRNKDGLPYELTRATNPQGTDRVFLITTNDLSYTDLQSKSNLTPGVSYYYFLRAKKDLNIYSGYSSPALGFIPLKAPVSIDATEVNVDACVLEWSKSDGANYYQVARSETNGGPKIEISGWIPSFTYSDTTGYPGQDYYYYVRAALSKTGETASAYSDYAAGRKSIRPPANVKATQNLVSSTALTWNSSVGAKYYQVYRSETLVVPDRKNVITLSSWIADTKFNDTTGIPGKTYYYYVKAAISVGGASASLPTLGVPGLRLLGAPETITATENRLDNVQVSWTASVGERVVYQVYRKTADGTITPLTETMQSAVTYTDAHAASGIRYSYAVKAASSGDTMPTTDYSPWATGIVRLTVPVGTKASQTLSDRIQISWNANPGLYYQVYRSETLNGVKTPMSNEWLLNHSPFSDRTIAVGKTYYYYVRSSANQNGADPSDYTVAVQGARATEPPAMITATDSLIQKVDIAWSSVANAVSYQVCRSNSDDGAESLPVSTWIPGLSFTDTMVIPGQIYYYFVRSSSDSAGTIHSEFQPDAVPGNALMQYHLTVKSGTGTGYYFKDSEVSVTADAVSKRLFDRWTGDVQYVADSMSATTVVTMPDSSVTLVATYIEYPAYGTLIATGSTVIASGETTDVVLALNNSVNVPLTVPFRYNTAEWTASSSAFKLEPGQLNARIRLTAAATASNRTSVVTIDSVISRDVEIPVQSIVYTVNAPVTATAFEIVSAPLTVEEGGIATLKIAGPIEEDFLEFSVSGLKMNVDYTVLNAYPQSSGRFKMDAASVCAMGIRIQILNNGKIDRTRKMTVKLLNSEPANLISRERRVSTVEVTENGTINHIAVMHQDESQLTRNLLPQSAQGSVSVIGSYSPRNGLLNNVIGIYTAADSVTAPLGWMTTLGYSTADQLYGQARVYSGDETGYYAVIPVSAKDLMIDSVVVFDNKPSFTLLAFDPFKDPTGLKNPKKSSVKIESWVSGSAAVAVCLPMSIKLYDQKMLKTARKHNSFYVDMDSEYVKDAIGMQLTVTYKDKKTGFAVKDLPVGALLLSSPKMTSVTRSPGANGTVLMEVTGSGFGKKPKACIEYSDGHSVKTKNVPVEIMGETLGNISRIRLTIPRRPAAETQLYILIDSGVGILAIPFNYEG